MKLKLFAALLAVAGLGSAVNASAATVSWFHPVTVFQDDNIDWHIKGANNMGAGILEVGDSLVSFIEITDTSGAFGGGPAGFGGGELTGVAAITVTSKTFIYQQSGINFYNYTFGPTGNLNAYLTNPLPGAVDNTTAMVAMYLDSNPDLVLAGNSNCADMLDCITRSSNGLLWQVDGFGASVVGADLGIDLDQYWLVSAAPDSIALVQAGAATAKFGLFNFGGSIMYNGTGIPNENFLEQACGPGCKVDVLGSGDILGGQGLANGAFARSDFDFQKSTVPEPATLGLLGLGLLGLGLARRRKA